MEFRSDYAIFNMKMEKINKLLENTGDMALKRRAKKILENINPQPGDKILDIGCGDGYYLHLLSSLGIKNLRLTGTDFDKEALKSAKKNLKNKRIPLHFGDLMKKLPFKANTFDKIVMSEVAEHLPDDVKGLKEVYRVLKPGGTLCLTVPNANYPLFWDPVNWILEHTTGKHVSKGFWAGLWNQHERLYKPKQIKNVALKAGFKVEEATSLTYWCLPFNHNIVNLTARMLYSGNMDPKIVKAISKYETNPKRPFILNLAFSGVNLLDKLNDIFPVKNSGVGVFVKATKVSSK